MAQGRIEPDVPKDPAAPPEIRLAERAHPESRRKRFRNIAMGVGVVLLLIILVVLARSRSARATQAQAASANANRSVPVTVVPVVQRNVPVFLDGLGNVNSLSTVIVKTRIDGQLLRFNFREGEVVRAGEELAVIDPAPSEAQLAQAEANRLKDTAALQNQERDLQRYGDLYRGGVIPQQQYNAQQSQVSVTQATIKSDEAQIQQARLNVGYCHIKAPITGRIGIRNVDPGNMVHASDANGLVVVTQMQPIAALFTLPEDDLPQVTQHMRGGDLGVEAWSRDSSQKIATGHLLTIDNQIDPNTGTFRCKALFDNKDGALYPNQFIDARLQVDVRPNALIIPTAAVQHGAQGTYVYVVRPDKTAEMRPVSVALTEGTMSVIGSGLNAGEQVVTEGADKLQPNGKVEVGGGRGGAGGGGGKGRGQAPQAKL